MDRERARLQGWVKRDGAERLVRGEVEREIGRIGELER
jgi:hypothetical protein